jgi:hypothetical protein
MTTANRYLNIRDDGTPLLERGTVTFSDGVSFPRLVSTDQNGLIDSSLLPPLPERTFEYAQYLATDTWDIKHSFGLIPLIQVLSLDRQLVACDIVHDESFKISTCLFTVPFAGFAVLVIPYTLSPVSSSIPST